MMDATHFGSLTAVSVDLPRGFVRGLLAGFLLTACARPVAITPANPAASTDAGGAPVMVTRPAQSPTASATALPKLEAATAAPPPVSLLDVPYASISEAQRLDLYVPQEGGPHPLLIYVHGGGWAFGDKDEPSRLGIVAYFVQRGYAVASVNYRLSTEATFPAQVRDVKAATRWLRAHAAEFQIDPARVAAWGASAGGNLVSMLGTTCGVANLEGEQLGAAEQSSCVQAVIDWYGPMDFLSMDAQFAGTSCPMGHSQGNSFESDYMGFPILKDPAAVWSANPIAYVSIDDPPFLIQHGTADCIVPPAQSQMLYNALASVIGPNQVVLNILEGVDHDGAEFTWPANLGFVLAFLQTYLE